MTQFLFRFVPLQQAKKEQTRIMASENENIETITGLYCYIANPCTTDPCLPGMAYAVLANRKYYYITVDDHWFSENRLWDEYMPQQNDLVIAKGYVREKKDAFGNPYYTIEVVSLKKKN